MFMTPFYPNPQLLGTQSCLPSFPFPTPSSCSPESITGEIDPVNFPAKSAWLRAESHWEDRPNDRYAESYKRQFAEQEFNAVKRKCKGYAGQKTDCIVAVKKEHKKVKHTIIKSVVGTLDLSIKSLFQGESFPGEKFQVPLLCNIQRQETSKYGYIANLCVAKSARRKGIAINMLAFAIESAKSNGAETIFVHVHRKTIPAQQLYQRLGFEIVDEASQNLDQEQMYLLSIKA